MNPALVIPILMGAMLLIRGRQMEEPKVVDTQKQKARLKKLIDSSVKFRYSFDNPIAMGPTEQRWRQELQELDSLLDEE